MNIVQLQEQLKNFSQDQLVREMQMPSGTAPQFLVLGEIMRRQKMQQDFAAQQAKGAPQSTVAEDAIAASGVPQGGIADMARALAPSTDMTQNTGVQAMYAGGPVKKMAKGDAVKTDPAVIAMANRAGMSVSEYLDALGEEEAARVEAAAAQRAARNRMMAMEPVGDSITMPTQSDLDRRFQEEQFAFGASRLLGAPGAMDMPIVPSIPGRIIGAPAEGLASIAPSLPAAPAADVAPASPLPPLPATGPYSHMPSALELAENERVRTERGIPGGEGFDERAMGASEPPSTSGISTFQWPSPAPDRSGLSGNAPRDLGPNSLARIPELLSTEIKIGPDGAITVVAPEKPAPGRADRDQQGAAAVPTPAEVAEAEKAAAEKAAAEEAAKTTPVTTTPSGGAGGIAGVGGMSSYEQELMDTLARREKAAEQDKWLALAQVGLNMMSSTQPTLLGAIGEAGVKGVEAARTARDQYDKDRLDLLGALEQSRQARAAAAARAARGASSGGIGGIKPLTASGIMTQQKYMLDLAESKLNSLTGGMAPAEAKAMYTEAAKNGDVDAARMLEALTAAQGQYDSAYSNYMTAAEYLGALTMSEPEADDELSFSARD